MRRPAETADHAVLACECAGETLLLHHERAVFWPRRGLLMVADVHLGKESVFGRAGLAVPGGASESDLVRLDGLVGEFGAEEVVVLGDFSHAAPAADDGWVSAVASWLDRLAVPVSVVAGNHDRPRVRESLDRRLRWHAGPRPEPPFVLQHEPGPDPRGYGLGGHLHPAYRLKAGGDRLRLPAFWFRDDHAVLPAFGSFTGGWNIRPDHGERVYLAGPDAVLALAT